MKEFIERLLSSTFARAIQFVANFWAGLIAFGFFLTFAANPFEPDLAVSYEAKRMFLPSVTKQVFRAASTSQQPPADLTLLDILVANRSNRTIDAIEVRLAGIEAVLESGARTSSARLSEELEKLSVLSPVGDNVFAFRNLSSIPPGHNVRFQVVVRRIRALFPPELVQVTSSADTQSITEHSSVTGIAAVVYEHGTVLWTLLIAAAIGLGLRRAIKKD